MKAPQPPRLHSLLVWIIFDELSYDQLFEHRAPDLALPNFDALRRQSTLFTKVIPAGYKTVKIIPSLLSGQIVDNVRYDFQNHFMVHNEGQNDWRLLDGDKTVFGDAQKNGWRTAVVGWYNPYCTIYGNAIDDCYWTNWDRMDNLSSEQRGFWRNTLFPLQELWHEVRSSSQTASDLCTHDVQQRLKTHIDLEQHTLQLLHTDQADFIFLHLAIPHSPNIWGRLSDKYANHCGSSYLDNLALTDREMGRFLYLLQESPRWKNTTLIVEGDHSWRIREWKGLPAWTREDETAARGIFDPRPALLIHQAGQSQPRIFTTEWPLIRVHKVVEQVLHSQPVDYE